MSRARAADLLTLSLIAALAFFAGAYATARIPAVNNTVVSAIEGVLS